MHQLFGIFATIVHLATGQVDSYGPGHCVIGYQGMCGPYQYYAQCQDNAAKARKFAKQFYGDQAKVTITCAPIKSEGNK